MTKREIDRTLQRGLVGVYALCVVGGLSAVFWQPPAMVDQLSWGWVVRLWAVFLLLGGLICLGGTMIPRGAEGDWFGEFAGLPLLAAAIATYGIVGLTSISSVPGRICGACLLLAFALLAGVRWLRVRNDALVETGKKEPKPPTPTTT